MTTRPSAVGKQDLLAGAHGAGARTRLLLLLLHLGSGCMRRRTGSGASQDLLPLAGDHRHSLPVAAGRDTSAALGGSPSGTQQGCRAGQPRQDSGQGPPHPRQVDEWERKEQQLRELLPHKQPVEVLEADDARHDSLLVHQAGSRHALKQAPECMGGEHNKRR